LKKIALHTQPARRYFSSLSRTLDLLKSDNQPSDRVEEPLKIQSGDGHYETAVEWYSR